MTDEPTIIKLRLPRAVVGNGPLRLVVDAVPIDLVAVRDAEGRETGDADVTLRVDGVGLLMLAATVEPVADA